MYININKFYILNPINVIAFTKMIHQYHIVYLYEVNLFHE